MKLASLKSNSCRDGRLIVVSRDLQRAAFADGIASTLLDAMERWQQVHSELNALYVALNQGDVESFAFDPRACTAPLPRTYQWLDGSAFLSHSALMQTAFNLPAIEGIEQIPLMYQGAGDDFIGGYDPIPLPSEQHGIDFEGEVAVIVDDVPMGCSAAQALSHIRLIVQLNDVSLRALAPREMKTGFGFLQAKPSTSFAPLAITPDELGEHWHDGRLTLPLTVQWNGEWFGNPSGAAMQFGFHQLIAHAALTRNLSAGTLVGSGTFSNPDRRVGSACISERRAIEMIASGGQPSTPFMAFGDRIQMDIRDENGLSLFGGIDQEVVRAC
ncbi:fumarylacetoacetate hydrolase family protein [Pokkaliibacter sp. MBI-7]|uniref:fumarylacetoacetate hydrolase family protein n=1 Tax=Pokkaliibacter sp. MBI-7 TaxID=3040600 RepID=UPI002448C884|nr:fumarylacetoacetate hydrolase family protein [Pokkaliibacter sp. MBI-7]MDH2435540.1 fumarylacetoacetate hydrolase family protein [Pokkaliibacter sp. MBI-7]